MNPRQFFRGKHAELCIAIAEARNDEAFSLIYGFFRSEDNTDSYSIQLLTIVRELLEGEDSDELYKLRIRFRSNGDKVLINMVQFLYAFDWNGSMFNAAEILSEKLEAEIPKLARSMQIYVNEEGIAPMAQLQGLRIREAIRLFGKYFADHDDEDRAFEVYTQNLDVSRILLFNHPNTISDDLLVLAKESAKRGLALEEQQYLREIVENYDENIDIARSQKPDIEKELLEVVQNLKEAYTRLEEIEHDSFNVSRLEDISVVLATDE
ncbi:MAG: hypothetical protein WC966_10130 [Bradymonadales bacterium]|jgi:hypothetical protein